MECVLYIYIYIYIYHHVVLPARISLTLSRHFSLSFIASGRSSGLHPVSLHSCCMYVQAGRPAFARPYVGSNNYEFVPASLAVSCMSGLSNLDSFHDGRHSIVGALWGVATRACSLLLAAFLCNYRLASFPAV